MKNFMRVCAAVLVVGIALCIGGAAAGGRLYSSVRGNALIPFDFTWWGIPRLRPIDELETEGRGRQDARRSVWEPAVSSAEPPPFDLPPDAAGADLPELDGELERVSTLKTLDFELGGGNYEIVVGDDYGLLYDGDWVDSEIEDGVWKLRTDSSWFNLGLVDSRSCTITVPANCAVDKLEWTIGTANVEISAPISAEKIEMELGGANVEFFAPISAKNVEIELGAGNLEIDCMDFSDWLEAEVGAGNLSLGLPGAAEDYFIDAEVAMGTVALDGDELASGLVGTCFFGDKSARRIDIDLGMGNVDLTTGR